MIQPVQTPSHVGRYSAVAALVAVVIGIIAVAFRGSWGAFRDAALACHFDQSSADLYPFAADGLIIVAILAAVLLRHVDGARWYCMSIIGTYTGASLLINFLHGLGMFAVDPVTGARPVPPWGVVIVVASIVVMSIFLGTHLLVLVGRHLWPKTAPEPVLVEAGRSVRPVNHDVPDVPEPPASAYEAAVAAYRWSKQAGGKGLSQLKLVDQFGVSKREAAQIQHDVNDELDAEGVDEEPEPSAVFQPDGGVNHLNGVGPKQDQPAT